MNAAPPDASQEGESARWTYLRGALFLAPALLAWVFSFVLILPTLDVLWERAGMSGPRLQWLIDSSNCFVNNGRLILVGTALLFIGLERFSSAWPRYRRVVVGSVVFILNAAVLVGMAVICTSAMILAKTLSKSP